jgi:hypothetical protein
MKTMQACFKESDYVVSSEVIAVFVHHKQIIMVNADQNLFIYDISDEGDAVSLERVFSMCLYLDEVIDVKYISAESRYALLCSNSESLKLLDMKTGEMELYPGHEDIILTLDVI